MTLSRRFRTFLFWRLKEGWKLGQIFKIASFHCALRTTIYFKPRCNEVCLNPNLSMERKKPIKWLLLNEALHLMAHKWMFCDEYSSYLNKSVILVIAHKSSDVSH